MISPRVRLPAAEPVSTDAASGLDSTSLRLTIARSCNGRILVMALAQRSHYQLWVTPAVNGFRLVTERWGDGVCLLQR